MIFAGSLVLSCVRGASLEQTLVEDSLLATSMPATPVTEVQPEDHRNALDRNVLQRTPALTETDALTLLLDAPDAILAGELLAEFGSLTGLARATVANLRRVLPETKAARLVAALRLATLACKDNLIRDPFDTPERVYNAFGPDMRRYDREVLAVALLNTRFRLIKFEVISQ